MITTSCLFDMRAPGFGTPARDLYAAALEMAAFADEAGVTRLNLMEHHGSDDGYLPQPFVMGGGVAARTKRCRLILGAVILPLHNPVEIAEQIAVLDLMSGGRLEVIIGAGYVADEFAMFGSSLRERGRLIDEGLELILRSLRGERFEWNGRPIFIRPLPIQRPEDILLIGGGVEASAKRAGRLGLGFSPLKADLIPLFEAESRKHGHEPGRKYAPGRVGTLHLSRDPEATWAKVMPHVRHLVEAYAKWAGDEPNSNSPFKGLLGDEKLLRNSGIFNIWTPEELLERAPKMVGPDNTLSFMPLIGGLAPEEGWACLELLKSVIPQLNAMQPAAA